jgi:hypothetical protein
LAITIEARSPSRIAEEFEILRPKHWSSPSTPQRHQSSRVPGGRAPLRRVTRDHLIAKKIKVTPSHRVTIVRRSRDARNVRPDVFIGRIAPLVGQLFRDFQP